MKPIGIKWAMEPIKSLGVFFTHDKKLLHLKNFSEKIDDIKKLINIWSSRGLYIYGKVTLIKSLLIPKIVYISSLLPTPEHIIKELIIIIIIIIIIITIIIIIFYSNTYMLINKIHDTYLKRRTARLSL